MKFVLVNRRTPVVPSNCAACRRPLDKGYMRDLSTLRRYCGAGVLPAWNRNVPPLRQYAEVESVELIFEWRGFDVRHRLRAIRLEVSTSMLPLLAGPFRALRMACTKEIVAVYAGRLAVHHDFADTTLIVERKGDQVDLEPNHHPCLT